MSNVVWGPWSIVMQTLTHELGAESIKRPPCALCQWWQTEQTDYMTKRPLLCQNMETWPDFSCFVLADGRTSEELKTEVTDEKP